MRVYPEPCLGVTLRCVWAETCPTNIAEAYTFRNLMVDRGCDLIVADALLSEMTEASITLLLPEECRGLRTRKTERHVAGQIQVRFMQDGFHFDAVLDDFSTASFRISTSINGSAELRVD